MDNEFSESIIEAVDICDYIGSFVELTEKGSDYFGVCPFHHEKTASFSITPAKKLYFCFGCGASGNVITFTAKYNGVSYNEAANMLADTFGVESVHKLKSETASFLKSSRTNKYVLPQITHSILSPALMDRYTKENVTEWNEEGIPQAVIDKYGVRIDRMSNRIVYPVYDQNGNFINIKGRTRDLDYKDKKIAKYMNYFKIGEMDYFQGYSVNKSYIEEKNEIIIFEGIKSCMKLDSFGVHNSVSSETSRLNPYQIKILVGLHHDVVIAFDNDVCQDKIAKNLEMLKRFVNVYVVYDRKKLLGEQTEKCSPVDKGREIWEQLYDNRIKI